MRSAEVSQAKRRSEKGLPMKDDPDKSERTHLVERTIIEMTTSAMETAVEAGREVPEAA
jgi:hypothetical protein